MNNFNMTRMMQFAKLQLKEIYFSNKASGTIKFILINALTPCLIALLFEHDNLSDSISEIELLLILMSYTAPVWVLTQNLTDNKTLINKFMVPATLLEKNISLYLNTLFIGTVVFISSIIVCNIIMQLAIPLLFTNQTDGLHLVFGGGGNNFGKLVFITLTCFYFIPFEIVLFLWKSLSKKSRTIAIAAFILSYLLVFFCKIVFNPSPAVFIFILLTLPLIWCAIGGIIIYRGFKKLEFKQ